MATEVKWRGGNTLEHSTFTGAAKEITVDTDKKTLVVHDGSTVGGFPLAKEEYVDTKLEGVSSDFYGSIDPSLDPENQIIAGVVWADTLTNTVKRRNDTNTDWVVEGTLFKEHLPEYEVADIPLTDIGPIYVIGRGPHEWDIATAGYKATQIWNQAVVKDSLKSDLFNDFDTVTLNSNDFFVIVDQSDSNFNKKASVSDITNQAAFPSGTTMPFYQTDAPIGWTKVTNAALNDSILRIVTGAGGVTGGSTAFSTFNAQTAVGATTLSDTQMPYHWHHILSRLDGNGFHGGASLQGCGSSGTGYYGTSGAGGGRAHSHSITTNIKYANFIVASKD